MWGLGEHLRNQRLEKGCSGDRLVSILGVGYVHVVESRQDYNLLITNLYES